MLLFYLGIYFHVILQSSETYADSSLTEVRAKLKFSSKLFVEKFLPRNEKLEKNRKIDFADVWEQYASLENKNSIWPLLEEGSACRSPGMTQTLKCLYPFNLTMM